MCYLSVSTHSLHQSNIGARVTQVNGFCYALKMQYNADASFVFNIH